MYETFVGPNAEGFYFNGPNRFYISHILILQPHKQKTTTSKSTRKVNKTPQV